MDKLYTKAFVDEVKGDDIIAVASTEVEDRMGDVIDSQGWELENFKEAPRLLWAHDSFDLPVGKVKDIWVEENKLKFKPEFQEVTEKGQAIKELFKQGFLNTFSVGFKPLDTDSDKDISGERITKQELMEISVVNVPANPEAMTLAYKTLDQNGLAYAYQQIFDKKATGSRDLPTHDSKERKWDGQAAVKRLRSWAGGPDKENMDFVKYGKAFAWHDSDQPEEFGSYKLPFADVIDGEAKAVWSGVVAAMTALLGGRGGTDIPEDEKKKVYNLLASYYKKFDEEPPEFKTLEQRVAELEKQQESVVKGLQCLAPPEGRSRSAEKRQFYTKSIARAADKMLEDGGLCDKNARRTKTIKQATERIARSNKGEL